ncbi:MAG: hypothetical protein VYC39_06020 [Myxococcota bacterium]|nr:hypothetical protein [Myxococcota bacterium]
MNTGQKSEQQQLRPYRYVVGVFLAIIFAILMTFLVNGIVRHLDRLPSVEQYRQLQTVDSRALKACGLDLQQLEINIRNQAGKILSQPKAGAHEEVWQSFEEKRLKIVARCKLNQESLDPAHVSLAKSAELVESELRSFHLLLAKFNRESKEYASEFQAEILRFDALLKKLTKGR